jgi:hypothetical protein
MSIAQIVSCITERHKIKSTVWCLLVTSFLLATLFAGFSSAETLVMPRELVDLALSNHCTQISDFFERPGMINPPFVYGWVPRATDSAVFWCKKVEKSEKPYKLMFKVSNPKQLAGCPAIIEWWNPPAGLSIEIRHSLSLRDFRYSSEPRRVGPSGVILNARVIVDDNGDGLREVFYCYRGQWLVASFE